MEAEQLTLRHHRGTLYKKMYPINNKFLSKLSCITPDEKKDIMQEADRYRRVDKLVDYLVEKQGAFSQLLGALRSCMQDGHATAFHLQHAKTMKVNTIREQKQRENERKQLRDEQMKNTEKTNQSKNTVKKDNNVENVSKDVPGLCHNPELCTNHKNVQEEDNRVKDILPKQIQRLDLFIRGTSLATKQNSFQNCPLGQQAEKVEQLVDELDTARKDLCLADNLPLVEAVKKRDEDVVNNMQKKYAKTIANLSMNNRRLTKELDEEKTKNSLLEKEIQELRSSQIVSSETDYDQDGVIVQQDMVKIDRMGSCTSIAAVSKTVKRRDSNVSETSNHAIIVGKTGASVNIVNCKHVHIHHIG